MSISCHDCRRASKISGERQFAATSWLQASVDKKHSFHSVAPGVLSFTMKSVYCSALLLFCGLGLAGLEMPVCEARNVGPRGQAEVNRFCPPFNRPSGTCS